MKSEAIARWLVLSVGVLVLAFGLSVNYSWSDQVDKLIKLLLNDPYSSVRGGAAITLGQIKDPRAIKPLRMALMDPSPNVRGHAAAALGKIGERNSVDEAIKVMTYDLSLTMDQLEKLNRGLYSDIHQDAIIALGEIGDPRTIKLLIEELRGIGGIFAIEALSKFGESAVLPLVSALRSYPSSVVKGNAARALMKIGGPAVNPLIEALRDDNPQVREIAANALGEIGYLDAIKPLILVLKDGVSEVRNNAVKALTKIGEPAVAPLIVVLNDPEVDVRYYATETLGQLGQAEALEPLLMASLKDQNAKVRGNAIYAVGKISLKVANRPSLQTIVPPLIQALKDPEANVRYNAADTLRKIGNMSGIDKAILAMINDLKASEPQTRRNAISMLRKIGDARSVEPLVKALKDPEAYVRRSSAYALGEIVERVDDKQVFQVAVDPLIELLKDQDVDTRNRAVETLKKIGDKRGLDEAGRLQP